MVTQLAGIRSTMWFGSSATAMLLTLVFSLHPRALEQQAPLDVETSTHKPLEFDKMCFTGRKEISVQAHLRTGSPQNQQPPKIAHKIRCQCAEVHSRKNGASRESGCGCFQHIVTTLMTASFVLKRL